MVNTENIFIKKGIYFFFFFKKKARIITKGLIRKMWREVHIAYDGPPFSRIPRTATTRRTIRTTAGSAYRYGLKKWVKE